MCIVTKYCISLLLTSVNVSTSPALHLHKNKEKNDHYLPPVFIFFAIISVHTALGMQPHCTATLIDPRYSESQQSGHASVALTLDIISFRSPCLECGSDKIRRRGAEADRAGCGVGGGRKYIQTRTVVRACSTS